MKLFLIFAFCALAVIASPVIDEATAKIATDSKTIRIPDGRGKFKFVDIEATTEINPKYDPVTDVRFLVFTEQNPLVGQVVAFNSQASVLASNFVPNRKTIFIAHGWQSNATTEVNPLLTETYLNHEKDVNVIVIDWSVGAGSINYITSRNAVGPTGAHVATFANNLNSWGLLDFDDITCAGQSLGSHVCGFFGKNTLRPIYTIFGLDPAGPLFNVNEPTTRLAATDAQYTECVHTDTVALGIGDPICHVDYYPNGGTNMPGCVTPVCDHAIAPRFHCDTIRNPGLLWGRLCANINQMQTNTCSATGGHLMGGNPSNRQHNLRGIFRMNTNENRPFGQGVF